MTASLLPLPWDRALSWGLALVWVFVFVNATWHGAVGLGLSLEP